ncbi:MAG: hypothetical protein ACREOR_05025, partial [Candidatus Binatia bacterium]
MALSQEHERIDESNLPRPYEDVRQWLNLVESMGELKRVDGADWNLEIGALAELIYRERSGAIPALLFEQVKGAWSLESGIGSLFNVISIKQAYPGHSRQALVLASQSLGGAYNGRFVVVVDEDIDPTSEFDVLWAMATRCDPDQAVEIIRRAASGSLD